MVMAMDMVKRMLVTVRKPADRAMGFRFRILGPLAVIASFGLSSSGVLAAERQMSVVPSVSTRFVATDNVDQAANGKSDFIFEVSPNIEISKLAGRLTGSMSASLRNVVYADSSDRNTSFIAFNGRGQYEIVEDTLFIDASGTVSRDDLSIFSGRGAGDSLNTDANNETRSYTVSPWMQFHFGNTATGRVRLDNRWTAGGGGSFGDQYTRTLTANLADGEAFGPLGWFADFSRVDTEYSDPDQTVFRQNARLGATYRVSRQLSLRATIGREKNDYTTGGSDGATTHGYGFDWSPSTRTQFSAFTEERIFGRGFDVSLSHRRALSHWKLSYTKDISSSDELISQDLQDAYFQAYFGNLQGLGLPQAVLNAIKQQFLAQSGLLITNAQYVYKNLQGDVSFVGKRNVLGFSVYRRQRTRLADDVTASTVDDFARYDAVTDSGASASLRHSLTPLSALTARVVRSKATGSGTDKQETRRTSLSLGLTHKLGANASSGLDYQHLRVNGDSDYTENRLTATLGLRF